LNVLGDRAAAVGRELTKIHEEFVRGKLSELAKHFSANQPVRGEIVLMISGAHSDQAPSTSGKNPSVQLMERVRVLEQQGLNSKDALKTAARELGLKRGEAYRLMVAQKNRRNK